MCVCTAFSWICWFNNSHHAHKRNIKQFGRAVSFFHRALFGSATITTLKITGKIPTTGNCVCYFDTSLITIVACRIRMADGWTERAKRPHMWLLGMIHQSNRMPSRRHRNSRWKYVFRIGNRLSSSSYASFVCPFVWYEPARTTHFIHIIIWLSLCFLCTKNNISVRHCCMLSAVTLLAKTAVSRLKSVCHSHIPFMPFAFVSCHIVACYTATYTQQYVYNTIYMCEWNQTILIWKTAFYERGNMLWLGALPVTVTHAWIRHTAPSGMYNIGVHNIHSFFDQYQHTFTIHLSATVFIPWVYLPRANNEGKTFIHSHNYVLFEM